MGIEEITGRSLILDTKQGERLLRILPNGILEVIASYSADRVSKEDMIVMREEQAKIWALGENEEKVRALMTDQERFMAMKIDQTPKDQESKIKFEELTEEQKQITAKQLLRVEGFRSQGQIMRDFSKNCTSWVALQMLYDLGELGVERLREKYKAVDKYIGDEEIEKESLIAKMWFSNFDNAAAVRERGEVNKLNIVEAAREIWKRNPCRPVKIGSIACGSSFVVMEAMKKLQDENIPITGHMVDINEEALSYTGQCAKRIGLGGVVKTIKGDVIRLNGEFAKQKFDILEAVGIMDYFKDGLATLFLRQIYGLLEPGGTLIASCIMDNRERTFLHGAVGWPNMVYRTPEEFSNLFIDRRAGFQAANCKSIRISSGLYTMVVARTPITEEKMAA